MVLEGALGFGDHGGCDAGIADEKHGIQCVPEAPQIFALTFREFHGGIVKIAAASGLETKPVVLMNTFPGVDPKELLESLCLKIQEASLARGSEPCLLASRFRLV